MSVGEDLERFVLVQNADDAYARAIAQLRVGRKTGHWMWFVFPQTAGLGHSETSRRYSITSLSEARAYVDHPVLGARLLECTRAVCGLEAVSADEIFGPIDAMKLRSSMTLFMRACPEESGFAAIIDRYFDGKPDARTDEWLASHP
jgi:uncharacterized protein (DUF1810 family)